MRRPRSLIEEWLPAAALGGEREDRALIAYMPKGGMYAPPANADARAKVKEAEQAKAEGNIPRVAHTCRRFLSACMRPLVMRGEESVTRGTADMPKNGTSAPPGPGGEQKA